MNKIKVVIIEDEIPASRLLSSMISSLRPDWDVKLLGGSIEDAVEWFSKNNHPDIIFLDIQLSDGNSFVFLEQVKPESMIIFTTAFDQYAVRAFSVNSIDYLLKPIHKERLEEAILKFETLQSKYIQEYKDNSEVLKVLESISSPEKRYRTRFLISEVDKLLTLKVDDIAYFYSENKITFAVSKESREHIIDLSLDKLADQLDPDTFYRANRQTILSVGAIRKIEPYFNNRLIISVVPDFKEKILISKEKISSFKLWLNY
jgi:DNA-binding LytR/AlgR family response regulator